MAIRKKVSENIVENLENSVNQHFIHVPQSLLLTHRSFQPPPFVVCNMLLIWIIPEFCGLVETKPFTVQYRRLIPYHTITTFDDLVYHTIPTFNSLE